MRSAAAAVGLTGLVAIAIPVSLMVGQSGVRPAGVVQVIAAPSATVLDCTTGTQLDLGSIRPGQCLQLAGVGFATGEAITFLDSIRGAATLIRADRHGNFSLRWRAARQPGPEVLTFSGAANRHTASCRLTVRAS